MELPVDRRRFATVSRLLPLARLQVRDPAVKPRGARRIIVKTGRAVWNLLHARAGLSARGILELVSSDGRAVPVFIDVSKAPYIDYASRDAHGGYEPAETLLIDALLPKIGTFYDIGANWGYFTWLAATNRNFGGRIYSFEISPQLVTELRSTLAAGGFDNVELLPFGLSDREGTAQITRERNGHLTRVVAPGTASTRNVAVRSMDGLDLPPPDLIKIDVEDHEHAVLTGGSRVIASNRPGILLECRDAATPDMTAVFEQLRRAGYLFHAVGLSDKGVRLEPVAPETLEKACNLFAAPKDRLEAWFT